MSARSNDRLPLKVIEEMLTKKTLCWCTAGQRSVLRVAVVQTNLSLAAIL